MGAPFLRPTNVTANRPAMTGNPRVPASESPPQQLTNRSRVFAEETDTTLSIPRNGESRGAGDRFEVVAFTPRIRRTEWKDVVGGRVGGWWEKKMKRGISVFVAGILVSALSIVGCSDGGTASETTTKEVTMTAPEAMVDHTAGIVDAVEALFPAES